MMLAQALFLLATNPLTWLPGAPSHDVAQGRRPSSPKHRLQGMHVGPQVPLRLAAK